MSTGAIEFVHEKKGYGFVSRPDGNDRFVHCPADIRPGHGAFGTGPKVGFDASPSRAVDEAHNVTVT